MHVRDKLLNDPSISSPKGREKALHTLQDKLLNTLRDQNVLPVLQKDLYEANVTQKEDKIALLINQRGDLTTTYYALQRNLEQQAQPSVADRIKLREMHIEMGVFEEKIKAEKEKSAEI